MYERKIGRAYGRGCLLSCATMGVGGVLGVALVGTALWLVRGGRVEPGSPRVALALALPILLFALVLGVAALWVLVRARRIDRAFAPLGLAGRQAGPVLRSWHGEHRGRRLDAWLTRGPKLELYLSCRPATRGVIHRGGRWILALTRALQKLEPMDPPPLALEGAAVLAEDEAWMRRLLERRAAREAVGELMTETRRVATAVFAAPDAVRYVRAFMPLAELNAENVRRWLDALDRLAAEVDAVGPSASATEPRRLETWARTERGKHLNRLLLGMGLVMAAVLLALYAFGVTHVGR